MTTEEFSNEFDTLVASYKRFKDFDTKEELDSLEFNEFEKSQFLTAAQEEIVLAIYKGEKLDGFESTEYARKCLDSLIGNYDITLEEGVPLPLPQKNLLGYYIDFTTIPNLKNLMFITSEQAIFNDTSLPCKDNTVVQVIPVRQDELYKIVKNPYRGPSTSKVIRVDAGYKSVELISKYKLSMYFVDYLSKPTPIILAPLTDLTINGKSNEQTCSLDSILHRPILERAVAKAVLSKVGSTKEK